MYISQVSGERLQDHWSSGFFSLVILGVFGFFGGNKSITEKQRHSSTYTDDVCMHYMLKVAS